jgi:site-specific DNA-methyltransferase (adenine-specific)
MIGMKEYPDKYFDLAIVDPPYGRGTNFAYKGEDKFRKFDNTRPTKEYFKELFRVSKNQIIFGGNYFAHDLPETNAWIFWDKNNGESKMSDGELAWTSLDILLKKFKIHWTGSASLWEDTNGKIHICQKPLALYKWLLTKYAKPNDKILDTHVGSASSLIACEEMGFDYIGFELDKDYYEAASKRIENYRKQEKIFKPERKEVIQETLL